MAIISKGTTFLSGQSVTANDLNTLVDSASFNALDGGAADGTTIKVHGSGYLQVKDGGITNGKLAPGAVNASSIADGTITVTQLADNAVTTPKIADSTGATDGVTTAKLADNAVIATKISATDSTFNVDSGNGAVGIGIAHEDAYPLKVAKLKIEADAAQIWFKDANEGSSPGPNECAFSLNERALRVGFTGESVASFAVFKNSLSIPSATVTNMPSAAADGALEGNIAYVSNGNAGNPCLALYIGTAGSGGAWKILATPGATISAS